MGFWDFLKKKEKTGHDLSDEDREYGMTKRNTRAELARLKAELDASRMRLEAERDRLELQAQIEQAKQQLEDLQGYDDDDDDDDSGGGGSMEDTLMTALLTKVMGGQQAAPAIAAPPVQPPAPKLSLEDQQIENAWLSLSRNHRKIAKTMTDDQIKGVILGSLPNLSDASLDKAVQYVRNAKV